MKSTFIIILFGVLLIGCKNKEVVDEKPITKPFSDVQEVIGIGRIEPENEIIQLSSEVGGIVTKIYKKENDTVQKGDVIFELKHAVEDATIKQLQQDVALQVAQIKVDESTINDYQIKYANAEIEFQRLKSLFAKGAETQQVVDNALTELQSYKANIEKSRAMVQVSKSKWKETIAQLEIAEIKRQQKFITAPVSGVLLELNVQIGNFIDSNEIVAQLNPEGKTIAVCEIDELFANKIKVGQSAIIRNFGALDTLSTGKVYFVSSFLKKKSLFTDQAGEKEDRRVREIKIAVDDPSAMLLNSRIECVVFISKNSN